MGGFTRAILFHLLGLLHGFLHSTHRLFAAALNFGRHAVNRHDLYQRLPPVDGRGEGVIELIEHREHAVHRDGAQQERPGEGAHPLRLPAHAVNLDRQFIGGVKPVVLGEQFPLGADLAGRRWLGGDGRERVVQFTVLHFKDSRRHRGIFPVLGAGVAISGGISDRVPELVMGPALFVGTERVVRVGAPYEFFTSSSNLASWNMLMSRDT